MDDAGRTLVDRFEIVADRLLARDVREGAEDGGEEARRFGFAGGGEANAPATRLRVDVDEAAVDLAAGGAVQERVDDGAEQIGRASCGERVCQYVYMSVVAVVLNKKNN